jgi:transposase
MKTLLDESNQAVIGVGIDTARYGHRVTFLRSDKQPAASPLDVLESRAGYEQLRQTLERLAQLQPGVKFHVRIDSAGQYAANLEQFLRGLPLPLELSMGEPARNAAYRKAHFPKRKTDASDSLANARYAVVERPAATPATPAELLELREVVSRLESQTKQTTRLINQLHNLLARVFPELAAQVADLGTSWVLKLLERYPTPQRLARARPESLTAIPYLKPERAVALQQAARVSVGSLQGEVAEALVRQAIREIELSQTLTKDLKKLMIQAFDALADGPHKLLSTILGIGPGTTAAIVAKVVSIDRFATPGQLVSYFGTFPEENTSGYDRRGRPLPPGTMHMSRQGNDLVRRYLWMGARAAILHNPAIRALYARQKARGKRGDVALGHCMRKLLHLVFAVWKTGRPFDPQHYPWEGAGRHQAATAATPAEKQEAVGHKEDLPPEIKVVTTASFKVKAATAGVNAPERSRRPQIDYAALRGQVTMEQALSRLGWLPHLKGRGRQLRGPCPIHGQPSDAHRSFSVACDKNVFRCFDAECSAKGNVLDLWAAIHKLPLYEAAVHLAQTFALELPLNREEEPVRLSSRPKIRETPLPK